MIGIEAYVDNQGNIINVKSGDRVKPITKEFRTEVFEQNEKVIKDFLHLMFKGEIEKEDIDHIYDISFIETAKREAKDADPYVDELFIQKESAWVSIYTLSEMSKQILHRVENRGCQKDDD